MTRKKGKKGRFFHLFQMCRENKPPKAIIFVYHIENKYIVIDKAIVFNMLKHALKYKTQNTKQSMYFIISNTGKELHTKLKEFKNTLQIKK